jgi:hypothetical protein
MWTKAHLLGETWSHPFRTSCEDRNFACCSMKYPQFAESEIQDSLTDVSARHSVVIAPR